MLNITSTYRQNKDADHKSLVLIIVTTVRGRYVWALTDPTDSEVGNLGGVNFWNGTDQTLGDGGTYGGFPNIDVSARVLTFGNISRTLAAQRDDLLTSLSQTELGAYHVSLDNTDGYFSKLLGDNKSEPLLAQKLQVYQSFKGSGNADFVEVFTGEIVSVTLTKTQCTLQAESVSTLFPTIETGTPVTVYGLKSQKLDPGTIFLIHSNATPGSTTFTDSGPNAYTITNTNTPTHSDTYAKWGATSAKLNGSNYITISSGTTAVASGSPFSQDGWVYVPDLADLPATNYGLWRETANNQGMSIAKVGSQYLLFINVVSGAGTTGLVSTFDFGVHTGEWVHIGAIRESGTPARYKLYANGTEVLNDTSPTSSTWRHAHRFGFSTNYLYYDELRMLNYAIDPSKFPPISAYPDTSSPTLAQGTFTHAQLASAFFSTDNWFVTMNFRKDLLSDTGVLFQLLNNGTETTLEIGIDASNYCYVTTGQDVEGTPATTTYTDSRSLDSTDISKPINLRVKYDHTNSTISFVVNGVTTSQAAAAPYDRTGTNDEQVTLGDAFGGTILNLNFNSLYWLMNDEGDNTLTSVPEIIGGLDLPLVDGGWEVWS